MRENYVILAVCVGRKYVYNFSSSQISILSMMDFVVDKKHRQQGLITKLSDYVKSGGGYDMSLGFSSVQLYETVYHKFNCFQKYYTYQFSKNDMCKTDSEVITDTEYICRRLSENQNSLHLKKTFEYMSYLKKILKYAGIMAIEHDDLLILMNKEGQTAKLLDISDYNMESCMTAIQAMLEYADTVQADLPKETAKGGAVLKKIVCCISDNNVIHTLQNGEDYIWIPVTDRR